MSAPVKRDDPVESLIGCIGLILSIPITSTLSVVLNGYVLAQLWAWFVVPTFHVAPISRGVAAGLALMVTWATMKLPESDSDTPFETLAKIPGRCVLIIVVAGLTLGLGWCIKAVWL